MINDPLEIEQGFMDHLEYLKNKPKKKNDLAAQNELPKNNVPAVQNKQPNNNQKPAQQDLVPNLGLPG